MLEIAVLDDLDRQTIELAGVIKLDYQVGMADAIVAATAMREKAHVLTGDEDFKKIDGVKVIFLE